jgi:hypothetical protein
MSITDPDPTPEDTHRESGLAGSAWGKLLLGLACLAGSFWVHSVLSELESGTRDSLRINALIALSYRVFGHGPTVALVAICGVVLLFLGLRQLAGDQADD